MGVGMGAVRRVRLVITNYLQYRMLPDCCQDQFATLVGEVLLDGTVKRTGGWGVLGVGGSSFCATTGRHPQALILRLAGG